MVSRHPAAVVGRAALRRACRRDDGAEPLVFAVWGALADAGPFATTALDQSFFPLIMFMAGVSLPSVALSADVTLRRRREATLRLQEQILRAMFNQAGVGIAQMDTTGRFNLVNNRFCEIVRHPAPQLLQMRIYDLTILPTSPTCAICLPVPSKLGKDLPLRKETCCLTGRACGSAATSSPFSTATVPRAIS